MGPRVLGAAVVQLNFWVNTWLASRMTPGSVAGLQYGFSLMLMAQAAIAQSVAIAAMPTFSEQFALGKLDEMRTSLATSLRGMLFFAVPASVGLILLRRSITELLFQNNSNTNLTKLIAWSLLWYAAGMIGHSVLEVLTRAFYAQHDTKTPVMIGVIAMGLNVVFSLIFSAWFTRIGWMPHGGLALANSLATALEATTLFVIMRKRLHGIDGQVLASGSGKSVLSGLGMGICLSLWIKIMGEMNIWITTLGGVVVGVVLYTVFSWALKAPELKMLSISVSRRIKG